MYSVEMERWCDKVAVVTGATRGIGRAIVVKLTAAGIKTVGIGRDEKLLEELSKELNIITKKCDITDETLLKECLRDINSNVGPIHILVNNAGIVDFGLMTEQSTENWKKLIDTNLMALCFASKEVITYMREQKIAGQIININSVAGHRIPCFAKPIGGIYPASKYAVTAVTETLRQEMAYLNTGIKITSLSPGYVYTDIHKNGGDPNNPNGLDAEDVADGVLYILGTKPNLVVKELTLKPINERF